MNIVDEEAIKKIKELQLIVDTYKELYGVSKDREKDLENELSVYRRLFAA